MLDDNSEISVHVRNNLCYAICKGVSIRTFASQIEHQNTLN